MTSAMARRHPALCWIGAGYAISLTVFALSGVAGVGAGVHPAAGLVLAVVAALLAKKLPSSSALRPEPFGRRAVRDPIALNDAS